MPINTRTVTEATCDSCGAEINTSSSYIDAGAYGAAFHYDCIHTATKLVLKALGLDDIRLVYADGSFAKYIYN